MSAFVYDVSIEGRIIINTSRDFQKIVLDCNGPMPFKAAVCLRLEFWGHYFKGYPDSYDPSNRTYSFTYSPLTFEARECFSIDI